MYEGQSLCKHNFARELRIRDGFVYPLPFSLWICYRLGPEFYRDYLIAVCSRRNPALSKVGFFVQHRRMAWKQVLSRLIRGLDQKLWQMFLEYVIYH